MIHVKRNDPKIKIRIHCRVVIMVLNFACKQDVEKRERKPEQNNQEQIYMRLLKKTKT